MSNLKEIKNKMKGISTTRQITSAMKLMSTAKLGKTIEQLNMSKGFISKLEQIVHSIHYELPTGFEHPCINGRPVKSSCFIVIGGERGLCGGFNSELENFARKMIDEHPVENKQLILCGQKPVSAFRNTDYKILSSLPEIVSHHDGTILFNLTDFVLEQFLFEKTDEVFLIYTNFISPVKSYLTDMQLLPLDEETFGETPKRKSLLPFEFEPSPEDIFHQLIPRYIRNVIYRAILESSAAEQSARMTAMTSATDRADEMLDDLMLDFNRTRQAIITQEIAEVIAGAET